MAVWDIIGNSLDNTQPDLLNSSYNNIFGDSTLQLVGGARTTNIIGADQKFLFDWEILVESLVDKTGMLENPVFKPIFEFMMGSGGNASINIGDNNSVNLLGEMLLTAKIGHTCTVNLDDPWPLLTDPPSPTYDQDLAKFKADYQLVGLANTVIVITVLICMSIAYFKYHNFTESAGAGEESGEQSPSIEETKALILGLGLGVENRLYLYINQYLQSLGKLKASEKLKADLQAKSAAEKATGAAIAKAQAAADAAQAAANAAQSAANAAQATANDAAKEASAATQAAAKTAAANAADMALINQQMASLEERLSKVLDTDIPNLQSAVNLQFASINGVKGTLEKTQEDLDYVTNLAESNNQTIEYLGSKDVKANLDKINPTTPSLKNLIGW